MERLVDAEVISQALKISKGHVWRLARTQRIPAYRIGRQVRFDLGDVLSTSKQMVKVAPVQATQRDLA